MITVLAIGTQLLRPAHLRNNGVFGHGLDAVMVVLGGAEGRAGYGKLAAGGEVVHHRSS